MLSGTDLARTFPTTAARLVADPDGNTQNAWDVLVSAFPEPEARRLVLAQPGGREALDRIGVPTD